MSQEPESGQRLRCPSCSRILKVPASLAGSIRRCPHCEQKVRIPGPGAASSGENRPHAPAAAPEWLPVQCDVCSTRFHATIDQLGTKVKCPDCGRANVVRPAPKPEPKWRPQWEGADYGLSLEPTEAEDATRVSHARELLMAAHEKMNAQDQAAAALNDEFSGGAPARTRLSEPSVRRSLGRFLLNSNVWPQWVGIVVALLPLTEAVAFIVYSGGIFQIMAVVLCVALAVLGTLFMSFFATRLMDVLEMTANDAEKEWIDWPDHDISSRFLCLMYFLNAAAFSALPGGVAAQFVQSQLIRGIVALTSIYLLFPVVLLSMIDHGSCMAPYSMRIWTSVERAFGPWLRFYLRTGVFAGVLGLIFWIGPRAFDWPQRGLVVLFVVLAAWAYVRWLGRVGLACFEVQADNQPAVASAQETESAV